jgi:hypothetical protein
MVLMTTQPMLKRENLINIETSTNLTSTTVLTHIQQVSIKKGYYKVLVLGKLKLSYSKQQQCKMHIYTTNLLQ